MGVACSLDRMRCLMRTETFISIVLFTCSMYMFFMVGYFTSTNRKILSLIFGVLGGLILVAGVITTSYAVTIWRDLRKGDDDVQTTESHERRVRFSSLIEIHEGTEEKPEGDENDELDHEYEEIYPPTPRKEESSKNMHPKVKLNCKQENFEVRLCPQLLQSPIEDDEKLDNKNLFREAYKVYLENKSSYGTFKGIYQNYLERDIEEVEHEDEEEIII